MDDSLAGSTGAGAQLLRMENRLADINARIARLALVLGVSLDSEQEILAALTALQPVAVGAERRVTPDRRGGTRGGSDRRLGTTRAELRGLLVLRYGAELRYVEQVGAASTLRMMQSVEQRLEQRGFEPGSDGVHLEGPSGRA